MATPTVHDALKALSTLDPDRAGTRNGEGFNASDTGWGNAFASQENLTRAQEAWALPRLKKYHRQLSAAGINFEQLKARDPEPRVVIARAPGRCWCGCMQQFRPGTEIVFVERGAGNVPGRTIASHVGMGGLARINEQTHPLAVIDQGPVTMPREQFNSFGDMPQREQRDDASFDVDGRRQELWPDLYVPVNPRPESPRREPLGQNPDDRSYYPTGRVVTQPYNVPAADEADRLLDLYRQSLAARPVATRANVPARPGAPAVVPQISTQGPIPSDPTLGPGGVIAQSLPNYEPRAQQIQLASAIRQALASGSPLVAEAGTGTGKSFAALVPAIEAGTIDRVIYATAVKALQEQVADNDVPFLQKVLPTKFQAVVVKGRRNYLCLDAASTLREACNNPLDSPFPSSEAGYQWVDLNRWALDGASAVGGDIERAPFEVCSDLKQLVTVDSETCKGQKCKFFDECYVERMKARAREARVVIVNHHLLLLDLQVRSETDSFASVLPDADAVILDEAHHLEDIARDCFGTEVSLARWTRIARPLERYTTGHPHVKGPSGADDSEEAQLRRVEVAESWGLSIQAVSTPLFTALREYEKLCEVEDRKPSFGKRDAAVIMEVRKLGDERERLGPIIEGLDALHQRMENDRPSWLRGGADGDEIERWEMLLNQVLRLRSDLRKIAEPNDDQEVRYAEPERGRITLHAKPIDVSQVLRDKLWNAPMRKRKRATEDGPVDTGTWAPLTPIAMSATMATSDGMRFWRRRVGLDGGADLIVSSPFDYPRQAMLYIPPQPELFDPTAHRDGERTLQYAERISTEVERLVLASRGRAFVLFTSFRAMNDCYERLSPRLQDSYLVLKQGELPRAELVRRFKSDGNAILFATKTFWEGVDVQGEALSLVIIDKLPFNPPGDPVWDALVAKINRDGGKWFFDLALPTAILAMKQGFGRLIRTGRDRGVVAILDGRLSTKRYGSSIVNALPDATMTHSLDVVRHFYG